MHRINEKIRGLNEFNKSPPFRLFNPNVIPLVKDQPQEGDNPWNVFCGYCEGPL